uniref:Uncharacterized protein n=1 Tax=viral metagenome TaxID=1070528 RepID=A0A6M3Y3W7_9ZZZZ
MKIIKIWNCAECFFYASAKNGFKGLISGFCEKTGEAVFSSNHRIADSCPLPDASQLSNPADSICKKIAECLTKMDTHVKNRNYGMAMKMEGAAIVLQEVLDEIESTSQSNTLVDGDKLCDFCGLCDFQKQKRKKIVDRYIQIFNSISCRNIEVFKRRQSGVSFEELAAAFNISRQRCQQIHSKIEWKIKLFIMLMKKDIEDSKQLFIEKYKMS